MAISLPLDQTACAQADDVFYCANADEPSLFDASGGRVPLSADDPDQQSLRDLWCALYEDILAHNADGSVPFPDCGSGHAHHPEDCRFCAEAPSTDPVEEGPSTDPVEERPGSDPCDPVEGCPDEEDEELDEEPTLRLRVSLFFDGTGNNRENVLEGERRGEDWRDSNAWNPALASYMAGESNVSKMERAGFDAGAPYDDHASVYVEGIGTTTGGYDDPVSSGTGRSGAAGAGVLDKVGAGFLAAVASVVGAAAGSGLRVEHVHVDAFGFSRGAAAARNFVHRVLNDDPLRLATLAGAMSGTEIGAVDVKFVGLYDTVAAFGGPRDHWNDTAELNLDAIRDAETVVQLAAAEEHRRNFSLTNINSAGANGTELFLPGVHSDIGGGYPDDCSEDEIQLYDIDTGAWTDEDEIAAVVREMTWFVASGWYEPAELRRTAWNEVLGSRARIRGGYQHIPLHLMARYARAAGLPVSGALEGAHPVPAGCATAQAEIDAAIAAGGCGGPSAWFGGDPAHDPGWLKQLRHDYLHTSAMFATALYAHEPRFSGNDPVHGTRVRFVYDG